MAVVLPVRCCVCYLEVSLESLAYSDISPFLNTNTDSPLLSLYFLGHVSGDLEGNGFTQVDPITSEIQPCVIFP